MQENLPKYPCYAIDIINDMNNHTFHKYIVGNINSLPQYIPSFEEICKQMRINVDALKKEVTDHINQEIERFNSVIKEEFRKGIFY